MASVSYSISGSQTGSGTTSWSFTNSNFSAQLNTIPAYATITKCTLNIQGKGSVASTSLARHKMYVYIGSTQIASNTDVGMSYETIVNQDIKSYVKSGTSDAGSLTGTLKIEANRGSLRTSNISGSITWEYTEPCTVTVNINPAGGGTVSGTGTYTKGTTATVTAIPADGYEFVGWANQSGVITVTTNPYVFTVNANTTFNAVFQKITYTISSTVSPSGAGSVSPSTQTVEHGATASATATANEGWVFSHWLVDGNDSGITDATITGAITNDTVITAVFVKKTYIATFKDENGTTLKTVTVNHGDTVTPPADPEKADTAQWNYTFDGWYDANGNKWSSSTTITAATTFTARYNSTVQTYTVRWFNHDGTLLETDADVPYGTKPTYNGATPTKAGNAEHSYQFAGWNYDTENGITPSLGTTYIDITAQFREIDNTYKVTWVNDGVVIEEDEAVPYGDKPDYNGATPTKASDAQYDYTFIGWSASVTDPAKPESELETVKGNITYTAVYSATTKFYPVRVILFDTDTTLVYEYGTDITLEAPAVAGYQFVKWTDGNTDNPRIVEVKGEATYQAVYERLPIPIFVNTEQVQAVYVNENTKTITYIIEGEIPNVNVTVDTVDGWHLEVSNTVPVDSHEVTAIYIDETKIM